MQSHAHASYLRTPPAPVAPAAYPVTYAVNYPPPSPLPPPPAPARTWTFGFFLWAAAAVSMGVVLGFVAATALSGFF